MIHRTSLVFLFACFVCAQLAQVETDTIKYNVDGKEIDVIEGVSQKDGDNATLTCIAIGWRGNNPKWYKDGKQIQVDTTAEKPKYNISDANGTLFIDRIEKSDIGIYNCMFELDSKNYSASVHLYAVPRIEGSHDSKSKNLVQGDPLVLDCKPWAYPEAEIEWYKGDFPINTTDERVTISNVTTDAGEVIVNGKLRIENMDYPDRDDYVCMATNAVGNTTLTILIRVKDKLAALWPFLGICAEVAILCIIIFIYERKRAKQMAEEERREEADHLTNSNDHKGTDELRHRK